MSSHSNHSLDCSKCLTWLFEYNTKAQAANSWNVLYVRSSDTLWRYQILNMVSAWMQPHFWIESHVMWKVKFIGFFLELNPTFWFKSPLLRNTDDEASCIRWDLIVLLTRRIFCPISYFYKIFMMMMHHIWFSTLVCQFGKFLRGMD